MLQTRLESGWGILVPVVLVGLLAVCGLSFAQWRIVAVTGLLVTAVMVFHKSLRHFVLLPSCVVFGSGMALIAMNPA